MERRISISPERTFTSPLIIYKIVSETAHRYAKLIMKYLLKKLTIKTIFVQKECYESFVELTTDEDCDKIKIFTKEEFVDLCIVIGGDGTVLWCNNMFDTEKQRPPFLTFNLGTLGYMTYYNCDMYKDVLEELLDNNEKSISFEKRSTLSCKFISIDPKQEIEKDTVIALNDIVLERGDGTHLVSLEVYVNNEPMTTVKGDGLIISTSTGSTAYSLSAGGTIIHYDVDCILLNAICPHSLSFRAIAFPRDITLKIIVSQESYTTWVANDGVRRTPRKPKQGVEINLTDKYVNILILEKFISIPLKIWRQRLIEQMGWNNAFKNIK
jgi:NAD+ kinase